MPTADRDLLSTYRAKRDFDRTPEPSGAITATATGDGPAPLSFVVQRHRASRLHYDFRLQWDGVLLSWAVPKGPTLDPDVKRGAFKVEDHPLEYFDFEGVIPAGEYGGGDVIVWDVGRWIPDPDKGATGRQLEKGELHFDLEGEKLRGRFVLIRTRTDANGKEAWLLKHKHDGFAVSGWDAEDHPRSVLTDRTNDEVKADPDRLWRSDAPADQAAVDLRPLPVLPPTDEELAALDELGPKGAWTVFGREVRLTNLDKELFPGRDGEPPVTKRDLVRYTALVAPTLLPYLARRALNMHRFPQGAQTTGFWHKELPSHAPDWLPRWDNPDAADDDGTAAAIDPVVVVEKDDMA